MTVTDELIRNVVQEVLSHMRNGQPKSNGQSRTWGVFEDVNAAVTAAIQAQRAFERRGLEDRRKAVACIRNICSQQAAVLRRAEPAETKIGRLPHQIDK